MAKTIVVSGYGTGISDAVARRFGREGFQVALVSRNAEKLSQAARTLSEAGVNARGFAADLGIPTAVSKVLADIRVSLGPVTVLHWNAYLAGAGDLVQADPNELRKVLDVSVVGLVAGVQAALPDLEAQGRDAAVLVTGGGLAFFDPNLDARATEWGVMGLAIATSAQHKTVGLLHQKLKGYGIYVGEVVVTGRVRGTAFDQGNANLGADDVAERFWQMYTQRHEATTNI